MTVHPFVENKVRNPEAIIPSLLAKNLLCGQSIPAFNSLKKDFLDAKTRRKKELKFGVGGIDDLSIVCVLSVIIFPREGCYL